MRFSLSRSTRCWFAAIFCDSLRTRASSSDEAGDSAAPRARTRGNRNASSRPTARAAGPRPGPGRGATGTPSAAGGAALPVGRDASSGSFHVAHPVLEGVQSGGQILELTAQRVGQVLDRLGELRRRRGELLAGRGQLPPGGRVLGGQLVIQPAELGGLEHELPRRGQVLRAGG